MASSYPTRNQYQKIWKINDITKNINTKGTHPSSFGDTAIFMGGNSDAASSMQEIDTVQISTAGNSTDFGDLTAAKFDCGGMGGNFRGICTGGRTPSVINVIEYIHFASTGNGADFGDLTSARLMVKSINNLTRGVTGSGATPSNSNVIDFITIQTLGNAVDFGDLTVARSRTGATQSPTRGVWGGGFVDGSPAVLSNVLDFIEIASTGNATDFGDLATATSYSSAYGSQVSGMWGGGATPSNTTKIEKINFGSLGNATNFGNLRTARGGPGGATANSTKGIYAGGENPSGTTWLNEIETESLTSSGTGVDFGDLSRAKSALAAASQAHGGLAENFPRAPELYSPTGKPLVSGAVGVGDLWMHARSGALEFGSIATLGNGTDFGDCSQGLLTCSSNTRGIHGQASVSGSFTEYVTYSTKGNASFFGNQTVDRQSCQGASSSTRGIFFGGETPSPSDVIDYIIIATIGNSTDFGNLTQARGDGATMGNSTRITYAGGYGSPAYRDNIDYVTIASTGNATDFGDTTYAGSLFNRGSNGSTTRGIIGGGYNPSHRNVIQYITIASTGNATDFGDLTVTRAGVGGAGNGTRGLFLAGYTPSNNSTIDYITVASTGNATDFGDTITGGTCAASSNAHAGLT